MSRLFESIGKFGPAIAIIEENGNLLTYEELVRRADEIALPLGGRCLVSIDAANELPPLLAYVGACRAGCPVILTDQEATAKDPRVRTTFSPSFHFGKTGSGWGFTDLRRAETPGPDELHPELSVLLSTSGSTGSPKLVRLSAGNLNANALSIAEYLQIQPVDRAITTLPFNYSFGLSVINSHLLTGASLSLSSASVLDAAFWLQVGRDGVTNFAGVPRTYELLEHAGFLERSFPKLTHFIQAGGRLAPEKVKTFSSYAQRHGARFYVMYGQTEASPRMAYLPPQLAAAYPDCIGVAIPGGRFDLEDNDGRVIEATNTPGILCYRGPNVMMGYALEKSDLRKAPEQEKLVTGDIALRNDQGLYRIVGRANRFVKIAGLRLSLDDIQATVESRGLEAAVAGDDTLIAIAVRNLGDPGSLHAFLRDKFSLPPGVLETVAVQEIPRFPSGKTNFLAILNSATTQRESEQPKNLSPAERFRAELAVILGKDTLKDDETFAQAGGDSLNYVEGSLVVEKYCGKVVAGWDRIPFGALASNDAALKAGFGQLDPIIIARAFAITLAMGSHCFQNFGVFGQIPRAFSLIPRAAAPSFLALFGLMLARSYLDQTKQDSFKALYRRFLPNAAVLFAIGALIQLSAAVGRKVELSQSLGAIFLLNRGIFGNIFSIYSILFLVAPLLVVALRRGTGLATAVIMALSWGTWALFQGSGISFYPLSFFFGIGSEYGPSILQGLTLVLFGFSLGIGGKQPGARSITAVFVAAAALVVAYQLSQGGVAEFVRAIANIETRRMNHPYYYAYGIIAASALLALAHFVTPKKPLRFDISTFYSLGTNPMFAFGFGNIVLNVMPRIYLPKELGVLVTFLFLIALAGLTADVSRAKPRFFGPFVSALRKTSRLFKSTIRTASAEGRG